MKAKVFIGTSGWSYKHWKVNFYPEELKDQGKLHFYSDRFTTVEINTTFYHLPKETTVRNWEVQVNKQFLFSVKASQYITHRKRLKDCKESVELFLNRVQFLEKHLGPILFQLPPSFRYNPERLEEFLGYLPKKKRYAMEFRHESWFHDELYALLRRHDIGLCITDLGGKQSPEEVTSDFTYIRLHGPKKVYTGSYSAKQLTSWSHKIANWCKQGITTYCYFDNDDKGYAVQDALKLKKMLPGFSP